MQGLKGASLQDVKKNLILMFFLILKDTGKGNLLCLSGQSAMTKCQIGWLKQENLFSHSSRGERSGSAASMVW
jgi:hypothetical protein